jgi:formamidopyrimidine-DNA glycosylase
MGGVAFGGGYQDAHGEKGQGVQSLVVFYQKKCQLCQNSDVIKITLGQRGTYYCPQCQH